MVISRKIYHVSRCSKTQAVKVNASGTQTITKYNPKVGGLTIIKKDEETRKSIKSV